MILTSYDTLILELERSGVFYNQSSNLQMPIEKQVLIVIKQCVIYENDMSLYNVTDWVDIGYVMVDFII